MSSITVTIKAIDQASSVLKRVSSTAKGMSSSIGTSLSSLAPLATGVGAALNVAMGAATAGVRFFQSSVAEANQKQQELITTAGNLMFALKGTYEEGAGLAKELNNEAVKLGAALPGTAQEYATVINAISNDVIFAQKEMSEAFSLEDAKEKIFDIGRTWTLMAKQTGTSATKAAGLMMRLIAGDTNVLLRNVMVTKSVAFRQALDDVMEAHGKTIKDWRSLSDSTRVEFLDAALKMAVPEEAITAMTQTVTGIINMWKNKIFDQTSGILGFLRELSSRDNATVLGVLYELLETSGRLFSEMARLFPFKGDPMVMLYDAIDTLRGYVESAVGLLSRVKNVSGTLTEGLANFAVATQEAIGSLWTNLILTINNQVPLIVSEITALVRTSLSLIDFGLLGAQIGGGFVVLLSDIAASIVRSLAGVDYVSVIVALHQLTFNIFSFFNGLFAGIRNAILSRIGETLSFIASGVLSGLTGVADVIYQAFASLPSMVASGAANVVAHAGSLINNALSGALGSVRSAASSIGVPVPNAAKGYNTGSLMAAIAREEKSKGSLLVANTTETVLTARQAKQIESAIGSSPGSPVITVNISGGLTSPELIDQIIAELGRELNNYRLAF